MEHKSQSSSNFNNHTSRFNVVIRIRPELGDEKNELTTEEDLYPCVTKLSEKELQLQKPLNEETRIFDFDRVLGGNATQEESYNRVARKIVADVMEGYNGTVMAYGQTGSGKTYSIFGKKTSMDFSEELHEDMGIVPRAIKQIFHTISDNSSKAQFQVRVCFMQVYMEMISDLIPDEGDDGSVFNNNNNGPMVFSNNNSKKQGVNLKDGLQIREDPKTGIFVKGLKQIRVNSEEELLNLIKYGSKFRITNATSMNKFSSRSHAILQIMVEQKWVETESVEATDNSNNNGSKVPPIKKRHYKKGLLTIVDLAGSERISKSGSEGIRLEEAKKINISVSSLGNCINALANNTNLQHVPFRDSKLTRILTECLGGNSKTSICACVSPFLMNYDETITTLQFASRAIKIRVNAHINEKIEMKKMKERMQDLVRIKNLESMISDNKRLEKEANDVKSSLNNLKNDVKNARNKSRGRSEDDQDGQNTYRSHSQNPNKSYQQIPQDNSQELQEFSSITKKFHSIILHLQTELAKATVTINGLSEENKTLKEKLAKLQYF